VVIWKRRTRGAGVVVAAAGDAATVDAMRERIRRETEY